VPRNDPCVEQTVETVEYCFHNIDGVTRSDALGKNVVHTTNFKNCPNRSTSYYTSTRSCRLQKNAGAFEVAGYLVRNCALLDRDWPHVALCPVDALPDSFRNVIGLAETVTNLSFPVADYNKGGEREASSTFNYLRNPVQGN